MTNKPKDYEWVEYLVNAETRKYLEKHYIGKIPPVEIYDLVTTVVEKTIIAMPITQTRQEALQEALELVKNLPKWVLEPTDPLLNWKKGQNERDELIRKAFKRLLQAKIESV